MRLSASSLVLLLVACSGQDPATDANPDDTGKNITPDDTGTQQLGATEVVGMISDRFGLPVADVTVQLGEGESTTTDNLGKFKFGELERDGEQILHFTKDGYAENHKPVTIVSGMAVATGLTMVPVDFMGTFASTDGLSFTIDDGGPDIDLPAGDSLQADGTVYTGTVMVDATFYDLIPTMGSSLTESERAAAPGDYTGQDMAGEEAPLYSYGMFQVRLNDEEGNPIDLPEGSTAHVDMPMQTNLPASLGDAPQAGDEIPAWWYDRSQNIWVEENAGTVSELPGGGLVWSVDVPHFSTWNCDVTTTTPGCAKCTVMDYAGRTLPGIQLTADNLSYNTTAFFTTVDDGYFCIETIQNSTVRFTYTYELAGQVVQSDPSTATVSGGPNYCAGGGPGCVDLGPCDLNIPI